MVLSEHLRKIFARPRAKAQQAGQAVLEYILILFVVVGVILGILYQFNDAFKQFLDSYFGDYIACLLESGELPSLGGSGPNSSECISPIAGFTVAAGQSITNTGGGSGSSGSDGADGNSSSNRNNDSDSSSRDRSSSSSSSNNGRRPSVTSGGGVSNGDNANGLGRRGLRRRNVSVKKSVVQGADQKDSGFGNNSDGSTLGGGRRGRIRRRRRIIYLDEDDLSDVAKQKKQQQLSGSVKKKVEAGGRVLRETTIEYKKKPPKRNIATDISSGFSFGQLIKMMLILGILIAIFIFLGGQAVQIKKSWQKKE